MRRVVSIGIAAAGLAGLAAVASGRYADQVGAKLLPLWVRSSRDVRYGPHPENRLDLMESRWHRRTPRPAVLIFHGGGWRGGDRRETEYRLCRRYVEKGFLVANAEYRLGSIPAAVEDARAALGWFQTEAGKYGADPAQMVVTGVSAGAHLALMGAFQAEPPPRAVVDFYGPADLTTLLGRREIREVLPGSDTEALAVRLSPKHYVRRDLPPVLAIHGTADETIPPAQSAALAGAIRSAGGDVELRYIEGGGHGFTRAEQDQAFETVFRFLRRQ